MSACFVTHSQCETSFLKSFVSNMRTAAGTLLSCCSTVAEASAYQLSTMIDLSGI